MLVNKFNQ